MAATKDALARLGHIRDEIEGITGALRGVEQGVFAKNYLLRRAAERALLIISEAAKALPNSLTDRYPAIDWRDVRGLGNVLRHDYQQVDADTLWEILTGKLPELAPIVERMIADLKR
jgi:uncharacterized protein with HEPN domain